MILHLGLEFLAKKMEELAGILDTLILLPSSFLLMVIFDADNVNFFQFQLRAQSPQVEFFYYLLIFKVH